MTERMASTRHEAALLDDDARDIALSEALAERIAPDGHAFPLRRAVVGLTDELVGILFPQLSDDRAFAADDLAPRLCDARHDLERIASSLLGPGDAAVMAREFAETLPRVREQALADAQAILDGDPAAESLDEVVAAYPGFAATAVYRIAHEICALGVPIIPRLMTEVAHSRSGIDIHPGARIGASFCIDHGTGIVIGETAVIGEHVKLYQGVTLGALSVAKSAAGTKRHPTIGDRVVIYANATVLGGDTSVGDDSVIGGNVFLTSSVPRDSLVYQTSGYRVRRVRDGFEDVDFVI